MRISPARQAAFEILLRIEIDHSFSSVLLPLHEARLAQNDRGLTHELVLGTLRKQIYLDRLIDTLAKGRRIDKEVRIAIRLGAYQLLFLDKIPSYSAINESVNLAQRAKKSSAKGFVNAILRRIADGPPAVVFADDIDQIVVETSHPRWLIEAWVRQFGIDATEELCRSNNATPPTTFRTTVRTAAGFGESAEMASSEIVENSFRARELTSGLREMADAGEIYFQDEASQLVAQAVTAKPASRILDVCAAPGGKTTQIARDLPEAFIVAGDRHSARIDRLRQMCIKQGAGFISVVQHDAERSLPFPAECFDTVFVDAPCSGTGTIRHNPEIRYFLSPGDLNDLSAKQLGILRNASKLVQNGGRLIYSTCSLQVEEDEGVCEQFLTEFPEFIVQAPIVPDQFITDRGFARTFPHRDDMDGFFIAEFRKSEV